MRTLVAAWIEGSVNRRIFGASLRVGGALMVSRGAFAVRELAIAYALGTSPRLGAFLLGILMPTYIAQIFGSALPLAFIPTYIHLRDGSGAPAAGRLLSATALLAAGLLAAVSVLAVLAFPLYVDLVATQFAAADRRLATDLMVLLLPFATLRGVAAVWGAALNAGGAFLLPGLTPALTPLVVAGAALAWRGADIEALAWAMVAGTAGEFAIMAAAARSKGLLVPPRWGAVATELGQLARQFVPAIASNAAIAATAVIDQSMAALLSPSDISVLYYANLLILFPTALGGTTLGTAALPYVSEMVAAGRWSGLRHTIALYLRSIALVTIPVTLALVLLAPVVVSLVFERGAFTAADGIAVSGVMRFLALQIPFYLCAIIVIQVLSALRRTHLLLCSALISLGLKVPLNYLLVSVMGLSGIALSTSLIYAISLGFLLLACRRELRRRDNRIGEVA